MSGSLQAPALSPERARFWNALVSRLLPATLRLDNGQDQAVSVTLSCPVDSLQPREIASSYTCYVNCNGLWQVDFDNLELLRLRPELAAWHDADIRSSGSSFFSQSELFQKLQPYLQY